MNGNKKGKTKMNKKDEKKNGTKIVNMANFKPVGENESVISEYNGASVRKWAERAREMGVHELPKLYRFCSSLPIRSKDGKRVIVEGRYEIGCYWKGKPMTLKRYIAQLGFRLPTTGTAQKCDALIVDYKAALNLTGKYAPKAKKGAK